MTTRTCAWCAGPYSSEQPARRYCCKRCRQSHWRFLQRSELRARESELMRLAYADPPYPGLAHYYRDQPDYRGEVDHRELVSRLQGYDGWALSTSSRALRDVLPLCPENVRVCAWVKPVGVSRATFGLHSTWEAVIVSPARRRPPGLRDWLRAMPARYQGDLIGTKPVAFCAWLFQALGAEPSIDTFYDLFPGSGIVSRCWRALARVHQRGTAHGIEETDGTRQGKFCRADCGGSGSEESSAPGDRLPGG